MTNTARGASPDSFLFLAATARGSRKLGVRAAQSRRALAEGLRREKLLLLQAWKLPAGLGATASFPVKDQVEFNGVLGQLLGRGVPLVEALEVAASVVTPASRGAVEKMRELVAAGSSFADAAAKATPLDSVTVAVYRAAERTGDLGGAAAQLAATGRRQLAVSGRAGTIMLYPIVVLSVSIVVVFGMLAFIVPRVGDSLAETGVEMPWFSDVVIGLGRFLNQNWMWVLSAAGAAVVGMVVARARVGRLCSRVMRTLPYVSQLVMAQELARFFSVMAAMTHSGVPLAEALGVGNGTVQHPKLARQLSTVQSRLIEGGSLPVLIEQATALPLATRRLLVAAERSGELEPAFSGLAADMGEEVEKASSRLLAVLQPASVILMTLMIGSLILAIMIPMLMAAGGDVR